MTMPEASVDEYAGFVFSQHNIRFTWQFFTVQPVAVAVAHKYWRTRISGLVFLL